NMGGATRMNYTMMGDVVNTAARLEASAKQYGIYIQTTMPTLEMAGKDAFDWRFIDKVKVVGKSEAVDAVEIMADNGGLPDELAEMKSIFDEGMALYQQQEWDAGKKKFQASEKLEEVFPKRPTNPSRIYTERCDYFKANPPGDDWDGSWALTAK
ncbi:MAG: adenylate/guanylate cyclase domain-containing protein, partial [Candidatus Neomarinimicrobiota bacterium]